MAAPLDVLHFYWLISAKIRSSALYMKADLWSTNDGNASWTINRRQGPGKGTKLASGEKKNTKCSYYYSRKIVHSTTAQLWM